ncbi:MAG: MATE family efflux transporter [Planctomycetota bacterium]
MTGPFKELVQLAVPLVLAQLAQNTVSFVDTLMVGRLGESALAGIALGSTTFHFVGIVFLGVILGVSPVVSQATGANDEETASRAVRQSIWLGFILGIPAIILFWNIEPFLIWLKQPEDTVQISGEYLRAISFGMIPYLWIMGLRGYLEGKSNTRPIMTILFAGVLLNILLNDALMFGRYGLPALGLVGTGYASATVYYIVFFVFSAYIVRKYPQSQLLQKIRTPDMPMLFELVRVGGPIGLTLAFEGSMFTAAAFAMGTLGKTELAGHQIALQTASVTFMIPLGFAIATTILVGQAIGSGQPAKAKIAGRVGMFVCVGVMCFTATMLATFPKQVVSLYLDLEQAKNQPVTEFAASLLIIAAMFQIFDGLQVASNAALRGLKDTTAAMIITLFSYWGIGCTLGAWLCFYTRLSGPGLWYGMTTGLAAAAVLLTWRFEWKIQNEIRRTSQG